MSAILFATSNRHKFREAQTILKPLGINISHLRVSLDEMRSEDFGEIAAAAAEAAFARYGKPLFTEDSGLRIAALRGFPGAYSSWVFGRIGNGGILRLMRGVGDRRAAFVSAVAYCCGGEARIFAGECPGRISKSVRGSQGFGYDPIFVPEGSAKTFAENPEAKAAVSHRRKSLEKFAGWLVAHGAHA